MKSADRDMKDLPRPSPERRHVYGRRRGKRLRGHQNDLMETLLPRVSVPLDDEVPLDPAELFEPGTKDIWLEIGFGGGEHLVFQAGQNRDTGLIGCEPFINGVAKLLAEIETQELSNVRVLSDDARFLLERLKPESLSRIFILYPDPWPKKRHNKRRFINPETLSGIARALRPGGQLRFASDIPDYVGWTLVRILRHNRERAHGAGSLEWLADSPADWRKAPEDWPGTRYEEKAIREGRTPAYLDFRRL